MKKVIAFIYICVFTKFTVAQTPSLVWQKSLGGTGYEYAKEVELTTDGGCITAGYTESSDGDVSFNQGAGDCWIVKSDALGATQWEKSFGGTGFDYAYSIQQASDGGYIIAGYSESNDGDVTLNKGAGDCWIIKLDYSGAIEWQKTFGGTFNDNGKCIRQTLDGGYVVAGNTESSDGDVTVNFGASDCWILKLDSYGMIEWEKTLGGSSYDYAQDIKQTSDGGYVLCGGTHSTDGDVSEQNGNGDSWIVKLNNSGNIIWEYSFGGSNYDFAQSIEITTDGGYILAGYSESNDGDVTSTHGGGDCWIIKCNNVGNLLWQKSLGSSGNDYSYCIQQLISGGYILTGYSEANDGDVTGNHGNYDCWIVQLDSDGILEMQKSFGGTGVDIGYSIRQTSGVSYTIAGYSESNDGDVTGSHAGGDSWLISLSSLSLEVEGALQLFTFKVLPNPSTGNFIFLGLETGSSIEIYDVSGRIVFQTKETTMNYSVDLNEQAKGVYFYNVIMKSTECIKGKIVLN